MRWGENKSAVLYGSPLLFFFVSKHKNLLKTGIFNLTNPMTATNVINERNHILNSKI